MFMAVALICTAWDIKACNIRPHAKAFITEEACVVFINESVGEQTPMGTVLIATCFKVGEGV